MSIAELELAQWQSTYGLLTAQSILQQFKFVVPIDTLGQSMNDSKSAYFHLLRVPFKNVFNGIIISQVTDYRTYVQKLFIDYLLAGGNAGDDNTPGAHIRESLEYERIALIALGDDYEELLTKHDLCIASAQQALINFTNQYQKPVVVNDAQKDEIASHMQEHLTSSVNIMEQLVQFREQFYSSIVRVQELLYLHPTYRIDAVKQEKNREALLFDTAVTTT